MKLAWATDIHLDCANSAAYERFVESLQNQEIDALVITGDIAVNMHKRLDPHSTAYFLRQLSDRTNFPIYFVLGNHDFWDSFTTQTSMEETREEIAEVVNETKGHVLKYLTQAETVTRLTKETCLIGVDGWYDARIGNLQTMVLMNDFGYIKDLADTMLPGSMTEAGWRSLPRTNLYKKIQEIADRQAALARKMLLAACRRYKRIVFATHFPPFRQTAWYRGVPSDTSWLPFVTNTALGNVLLDVAARNSDKTFIVLCGHTHGHGEVKIEENLFVRTGSADYGKPRIYDTMTLE